MNGFGEAQLPKRFASRRLPGARRGGEVPDRVRPAAAAHHVRGQEARRRQGGADPVAAQPHPPGQDRHVRARLRQQRRGHPGRVRAVLRADRRDPDRPEPALHLAAHPARRGGHPPDGAGHRGRRAAGRRVGEAEDRLRQPQPGRRPLRRPRRGRPGHVPRRAEVLRAGVRVPRPGDALDRPRPGIAVPVRPGAAAAAARRARATRCRRSATACCSPTCAPKPAPRRRTCP